MKVELEIPDFAELAYADEGEVTEKDISKWIIDRAIYEFTGKLYSEYLHNSYQVNTVLREIVQSNSDKIIDSVIDKVSQEILRKKSIASEMPKKSELANISKEWENYFIELIDKAIAKRFGKA